MLNQFSRTQLLYGEDTMKYFASCRVAIFGIGGVGGYVVEALARSGIGAMDLIDDDRVCLTNLNRQILATRKTVGKYKVDAAEERIKEIYPECVVRTYKTFFLPETQDQFDFSVYDYVVDAIDTVRAYIEEGLLNSPSELYYPVRLKSEGVNDLDVLTSKGVDHIELRMFDLNPLLPLGLDERDVVFAHLLIVWIASREVSTPSSKDQIRAAGNYKRAARYDLDTVSYINRHGISLPMRKAALLITEQMEDFYREYPDDIRDVIRFERDKLADRTKSYSYIVRQKYGDMFSAKAIAAANELAKERR